MTDLSFDCMGTSVRLLVDATRRPATAAPSSSDFDATLSRFRPDSELCRLNADPREEVPRLAAAARGGLRGPAGRRSSRTGSSTRRSPARSRPTATTAPAATPELPLAAGARERAAARARAGPDRGAALARDHGRRPAPIAARRACASTPAGPARASPPTCSRSRLGTAAGPSTAAATCASAARRAVEVRHPLTRETVHTLESATAPSPPPASTRASGARRTARPATTCSTRRPATPAWTGLIGVTALAPTALEAEALAKAALLSGPRRRRRWLRQRTAACSITDDGDVALRMNPQDAHLVAPQPLGGDRRARARRRVGR